MTDPLDFTLPPPSEDKLSLVICWAKLDPDGKAKVMVKKLVLDCPSGGHGPESMTLQARMHQMVSVMGGELEERGWSVKDGGA